MVKKRVTSKQAEMQCSDVNPGTVQKAKPHPRARGI